jgi:hypothetical protein
VTEEFEETISLVLREHDTGAVDVTALRRGSITRARSIRRRRVGLTGAAAAVAIVGTGAAMTAASGPGSVPFGSDSSYGPSPGGPATPAIAALPRADAPGAAVRPDLVGHDPGTLHFDIDAGALGANFVSYAVSPGVESASIGRDNVNFAWYGVGQGRTELNKHTTLNTDLTELPDHPLIFGRPAVVERFATGLHGAGAAYRISWQPVDGLWASVAVDDPSLSLALKAANALKLNVAQRCVAPMHVASLPAGYIWTGCGITVGADVPWESSYVELSKPGTAAVVVMIGNVSPVDRIVPNTTAAGHPAQWVNQAGIPKQLVMPIADRVNLDICLEAVAGSASDALTPAMAADVAERTEIGTDFSDPLAWPSRPVG